MKACEIHIRDPFVLSEKGVYYMYGTLPAERDSVFTLHAPNRMSFERPHFYELEDRGDSLAFK